MRRFLSVVFTAVLLIYCSGCGVVEDNYSSSATFYYCSGELNYAPNTSVIQSEERIINCAPNEYTKIMQIYLEGPKDRDLRSPFPEGLTVLEVLLDEETTYVTFSTELSYLTGVDLTLACVCIANTFFGLTNTQNVDISAEHALLDNNSSVYISHGSTLLSDTY